MPDTRVRQRVRESTSFRWAVVARALTRPYRLTLPMVALMAIVPLYLVIARVTRDRIAHAPVLPLDHLVPVQPAWALIYGPLYLFLILLPIFVVHQEEHIRRTFYAYLTVWMSAYVCFLAYPTVAPRPDELRGEGFAIWGLRFLYDADPPYNCFPSIHVGHSLVSALTCYRVHRRLGTLAAGCALLVALSTLFTKQHYVVDVLAGLFLAGVAYGVFLRTYPRHAISEHEQRIAPALALFTSGIVVIAGGCSWLAYVVSGGR
jgi:membrane-associated phospholipid phosphatase